MSPSTDDERIAPPSRWLMLAEGRALWEAAASAWLWPLLRRAARGDGHAVLVLPGLVAADDSTVMLRRYLKHRNYAVKGWGQGRNLGPRAGVEQGMADLLKRMADESGRKVSLVGWSLGGIYARMLAARQTDEIRSVITLGSPFVGSGRATNAWRLYEAVSGKKADEREVWDEIAATPRVPTTSIYSRSDGVVAWQCSLERAGPQAENIEVVASHLGLGFHPAVLYALADRLAQPEGAWKPFDGRRLGRWVYPTPAERAAPRAMPQHA